MRRFSRAHPAPAVRFCTRCRARADLRTVAGSGEGRRAKLDAVQLGVEPASRERLVRRCGSPLGLQSLVSESLIRRGASAVRRRGHPDSRFPGEPRTEEVHRDSAIRRIQCCCVLAIQVDLDERTERHSHPCI